MFKKTWYVLFIFLILITGLVQGLWAAGGEIWYTNKGLNAGTNAFESFRDMFYDIKGANDVTEIAVRVDWDANENKLVAVEILVKRVGSDGYTPYPVNVPGYVPDDVLNVLKTSFGGPDPGIMEVYPIFVRKDMAYLPGALRTRSTGDDSFVWNNFQNPTEFKDILRKLNARLDGGLTDDEIDKNVQSLVMTTKGSGQNRSLVSVQVVLDDTLDQEPILFQGMDVYSILKDTYSAAVISRQLWQNFHKDGNALPVNDWPTTWNVNYVFRRVGQNCYADRIVVYNNNQEVKRLYVNKSITELERAAGVNFSYIAKKVMDIAGDEGVVEAKLIKEYNVDPLPTTEQDRMRQYTQNSFSLVSFKQMQVIAINAEGQELGNWTGDYALNTFGRFVENVSLWEKYFMLDSGYWKTQTNNMIEGPVVSKGENSLELGYDLVKQSFNVRDHFLSLGMKLGQEEFNYPFIWAGGPAYFIDWKFSQNVSDITKLVDELQITYRPYQLMLNELINDGEQALDNKYYYRNDFVNRRIGLENLEIKVRKTIIPERSWGFTIPGITNIVLSVPFQLPISYQRTKNIGGNYNLTGAAQYNNYYTYFHRYVGVDLELNFNHDTQLEIGNHHLRRIGLSLFKTEEQSGNTIYNGVFYSGPENPDDAYTGYVEMVFGYPDQFTGVDKFSVKGRFGAGRFWSFFLSAQMKIAGPLWLDLKYTHYEPKKFAYENVFFIGPVFKVNYK